MVYKRSSSGRRGHDRMVQLPVPIITKVVSFNSVHREMHPIQLNVTEFVSDLRQVGGFLQQYNSPP